MTSSLAQRSVRRRASRLRVLVVAAVGLGLGCPAGCAVGAEAASPAASDYLTSTVIARDDLSGPGTTGPEQALVGGAYAVSKDASTAVHKASEGAQVTGLRQGRSIRLALPSATAADVQVEHAVSVATVDDRAIGLYDSAELRRRPDGDHYAVTAVVRAGGDVSLKIDRSVGARQVTLARTVLPSRLASGERLVVQGRVVGSSPVQLLARAWVRGRTAPDWQVVTTDSSSDAIDGAGSLALWDYLSTSGTPQPFTLSGLTAWSLTAPSAMTDPVTSPPVASPPVTSAPGLTSTTSPAGFTHPGILVSASQLDLVRAKIAEGAQPWSAAFTKAQSSRYASRTWTPHPVAVVACGAHNTPDIGCSAETDDAQAAYTDALLWVYTGDRAYAVKSTEILNAWSGTLQSHRFDTTTYVNGRLQAAWAAEVFTKAAEIVRYTGAGWSSSDIQSFADMLDTAFLPMVRDGWTGGAANWELSMAEATMDIGVFTDDRAVFDDGVSDWRQQVKAAVYLQSDGPAPIIPSGTVIKPAGLNAYWYHPSRYVDGLEQEACRDPNHMAMGLGAAFNAAETGRIQGLDLYGEEQTRLVAALEYNTRFLTDPGAAGAVCAAQSTQPGALAGLAWEVGYNHYANRVGLSLPRTRAAVLANRPAVSAIFLNWPTLTSAQN